MRPYKKIITHANNHHADEILALALLRILGCTAPIERKTTPTPEDLNDPDILVIDVGREYSINLSNFDHHQNKDSKAACSLVLWGVAHGEQGFEFDFCKQLEKYLFDRVSDIDNGLVQLGDSYRVPEFNIIIRWFNFLPDGFDRALTVAREVLEAQIATARRAVTDTIRWQEATTIYEGYAIQEDNEGDSVVWREKAAAANVWLLICPNPRGGFSLVSRDSSRLTIPPHGDQTFLHQNGFMASYPTQGQAIRHAEAIWQEFKQTL